MEVGREAGRRRSGGQCCLPAVRMEETALREVGGEAKGAGRRQGRNPLKLLRLVGVAAHGTPSQFDKAVVM